MDKALALSAVEKAFGKDEEVVAKNAEALDKGYQWGLANNPTGKPLLAPAVAPEAARLCMNGNEAIALGALSAGARFAAFYPMTPSTSVMLNLIAHADAMGLVVEQAEDEIAAINMAIGGSFAGAPSMVATSGGGLALMTEGVSLAGMTETPVVIVVGQRPGPATGLPTRTEQADLQMVLHTGHGEFPRAVFAPGDIQECFHLTRQAFLLAEQCQSPIFLLTDQFLADSYRAVEPFDVGKLEPVRPPLDAAPSALPYQRFEITEDGISPRLLPGTSEHLVVADSDEHTPDGHITEDLEIRTRMVDKRLRKGARLQSAVVAPEYQGDESPEVLLLCWGSVKGSVQDATQRLRAAGTTAAMLHFSQVWPLAPEQFLARLQGAERAVCVEGNATGQFARLIRRETGFEVSEHVLRYDGLPITPEYVLAGLNSHVGQERG